MIIFFPEHQEAVRTMVYFALKLESDWGIPTQECREKLGAQESTRQSSKDELVFKLSGRKTKGQIMELRLPR